MGESKLTPEEIARAMDLLGYYRTAVTMPESAGSSPRDYHCNFCETPVPEDEARFCDECDAMFHPGCFHEHVHRDPAHARRVAARAATRSAS